MPKARPKSKTKSSASPKTTSPYASYFKTLRSCYLFADADDASLANVAKRVNVEVHPAGTVLFDMNKDSGKVYIIERGKVKVTRPDASGKEQVLNILGQGNVIGESRVLDDSKQSARVTCVEETHLLSISQRDFYRLLESDQRLSLNLVKELSRRLRSANENFMKRLAEQTEAIEQRVVRMEKLIEASKSINSTIDLDKLLGLILNAASKGIGADRGTVYLVDDLKGELWSKVAQGDKMAEIRLPIGKGIAGHVAKTGEIINIPDAYADPRFNPEVDKATGYRTRNMLCMPLKNKDGKIIGVFQLLNKFEGSFDEGDVQFIEALSAHAAVAIENARQAQELVQSERLSAVGRMASTIIHDIKNPMGTLRVYAQVMKKKSGNEEAAKLADEMIRQVDRFVNMAQEILDFSRGVSSTNMQDLEFSDVMNGVLDFIEKDLNKNNIQLVRKAEFKGVVKLDQDKMVRVFYNIASNARDAMPNGGTLTVVTEPSDGYVKVEFIDTGTGMPEEVKKRIFEPFVTYGKKHGTGLGMAIVKKVVDDHKGKIEIDSEMGKGTTIRFFIPAQSSTT
ncbi:MAG TPA: ATP-binding protein [Bacteroidota bacterium]|nr:ATP-binding protein [Bacteroidota bacterium]